MSYYFNNKEVTGLIMEYLDYPVNQRAMDPSSLVLREKILKEVSKVINGIIFTHKFTVWELYDDLFQEAAMACLKALDKFNPNYVTQDGKKTTAFSYFSLTAKRCLKFYTIRNKKNRDNQSIDEHTSEALAAEDCHDAFNNFTISSIVSQMRALFAQKKHRKFIRLVDIFEEYLSKMGFFNKRDFFRFGKSYGWSPNLIRKFLKIIKDNKMYFSDNSQN